MAAPTPLVEQLRSAAPVISIGVLTADWMDLRGQLQQVQSAGASMLHFDVMDGQFCPLLTFGAPIVKAVKTSLLKDVHLMVAESLDCVDATVAAGADLVTIPVESSRHAHRALQRLGELTNANDPARGIVRAVALNPSTPVEAVTPLLDELDMVFLLAVNPGYSGQKFITSTPARMAAVRELARSVGRDVLIAVDGGVTRANIREVAALGADLIVTGSAVFDGKDPAGNAAFMIAEARAGRAAAGNA